MYVSAVDHVVLSLENCIWAQPIVSVQDMVNVALVEFVEAAPEFMDMVPVGAVVSIV